MMVNEDRLISAKLLEVAFGNAIKSCRTDLMRSIYSVALKAVNDCPTVDAVEVVHANWIPASNKPGTSIGMKCSLCGARIRYSEFYNGNHNYCHKCGAKMDRVSEDSV